MFRTFKTFLIWLLIAALPIQCLAAVVKASCGPRHHSFSPVVMNVAEHHHDNGAAPYRHHSVDTEAVPDASAVSDAASEDASSMETPTHKISYCSACAACCFGAVAPPSSPAWTPAFSSKESAVIPPKVSFVGYIPAGLERPPRHLSA